MVLGRKQLEVSHHKLNVEPWVVHTETFSFFSFWFSPVLLIIVSIKEVKMQHKVKFKLTLTLCNEKNLKHEKLEV